MINDLSDMDNYNSSCSLIRELKLSTKLKSFLHYISHLKFEVTVSHEEELFALSEPF